MRIQRDDRAPQEAKDAFLEELIVRRELAMNFVNYTQGYDAFDCIPPSAQKTLSQNQKGKRDPNSYTGAAWIYGVHDRACSERPIFGKIRYMAASGLERKCDIQAYVKKADALVARA